MLLVKSRIRRSRIHGVGCFTEERIKKGQTVWIFDDRIDARVPVSELMSLPEPTREFLQMYGYEEMHEGQRTIVLCGDHARHMNHSEEPNLIDADTNIAARDIEAGEELTCNYYASDLDAHRKLSRRRRARTPVNSKRLP
jgi:SET domain-containing protein